MRYTVVWVGDASDELAEIWMASSDRNAVVAAANAIDASLAEAPESRGLPLSEGLRVLAHPPLRVLFAVNHEDRVVEVAWVQQT